jgi:flagellar hook protein FlgE
MVGLSTALEGLSRSEAQFNQAATSIARAPVVGQDTVDLSAAAVALLQARNNFEANTKLIKTADQMQQTLLNILA